MKNRQFYITSDNLSFELIREILDNDVKLCLSENSVRLTERSKACLDPKLQESDNPLYVINTGFGALYDI